MAAAARSTVSAIAYPEQPSGGSAPVNMEAVCALYPSLNEYMGLDLNSPEMQQSAALAIPQVRLNFSDWVLLPGFNQDFFMLFVNFLPLQPSVGERMTHSGQMQVAPITGDNVGLKRAEIKQGVRELVLCKDAKGMIGLRVRAVNKVCGS